jgi:hypothetical protein
MNSPTRKYFNQQMNDEDSDGSDINDKEYDAKHLIMLSKTLIFLKDELISITNKLNNELKEKYDLNEHIQFLDETCKLSNEYEGEIPSNLIEKIENNIETIILTNKQFLDLSNEILTNNNNNNNNSSIKNDDNFVLSGSAFDYSNLGNKEWPIVKSKEFGLVYIISKCSFGYYVDINEQINDEHCIVYIGSPHDNIKVIVDINDLKQPPFVGKYS